MQSLLGQFYSRIKGSQEDIASEGLAYILQRSPSARLALNKILKSDCGLDFDELSYTTQNIGDKLERPDVSGFDASGKEVLILEAKFWASLTENQPITYLSRLCDNSALVFICPTLRVRPVFGEIVKRVKNSESDFTINQSRHTIRFTTSKFLVVKTWSEILGTIRLQLVQANEQALISDIDQIIGLCDTIDSNAFQPIQSEDLSPLYPRRINSYLDLIDKVVDELKKRAFAETKGLRSGAQRYGYVRYFKASYFGVSLTARYDFWAECSDTPFWINLKDDTSGKIWSISNEMREASRIVASHLGLTTYETNSRELFFAIFPALCKTEDAVINDMADQIIKLNDGLEKQMMAGS